MDIPRLADKIEHILDPKPICRDCADHLGRCPNTGELCNSRDHAKELADMVRTLKAPTLPEPTVYMGWTFENVLTASRKIKVRLTCDEAESLLIELSKKTHRRFAESRNWNVIYQAVRDYDQTRSKS